MNDKIKHIVITSVFAVFMTFFVVLCACRLINPAAESESERRPLAQLPTDVTWNSIVNTSGEEASTIAQFQDFTVDQFPFRDFFRTLKAKFAMNVLHMNENNGYAMKDDSIVIVKKEYTEEERAALTQHLARIQAVYEKMIADKTDRVFLSVVPDKNYYFSEQYGYPAPDYDALIAQVKETLSDLQYVDLFDQLELSDYYKTDWHWNQACLDQVMATLGEAMNFSDRISGDYQTEILEGFHGGYFDQSGLSPDPEQLTYLTNKVLESCTVYEYATGNTTGLYFPDIFYNTENYTKKVDYDFFLNGRCGVQRIDNPLATTDKELVVFRDSYGASLLPLMAEGYKTIYSIDLRDTMSATLSSLIDFEGKDVLFLFSTTVLVGEEAFK